MFDSGQPRHRQDIVAGWSQPGPFEMMGLIWICSPGGPAGLGEVAKGVAVHDQEVSTESERAVRQRRVEDAIHSNEMEGLHGNADTLADADEYVAGRIDSDELVARARARYGLG